MPIRSPALHIVKTVRVEKLGDRVKRHRNCLASLETNNRTIFFDKVRTTFCASRKENLRTKQPCFERRGVKTRTTNDETITLVVETFKTKNSKLADLNVASNSLHHLRSWKVFQGVWFKILKRWRGATRSASIHQDWKGQKESEVKRLQVWRSCNAFPHSVNLVLIEPGCACNIGTVGKCICSTCKGGQRSNNQQGLV